MNNTNDLTELRDLLSGVQDLEQRETEEARAAYRELLFRLARGERAECDTAEAMHGVVKAAGRSATEFLADVEELRSLVLLAEEAKQLGERREADQRAAEELRQGRARFERAMQKAKARLDELRRQREETSTALYAADEARRTLLGRLGLDQLYERRLDALASAEARLASVTGFDGEAEADAQAEVERRRGEVWQVWERALALHDHSPFRGQDSEHEAAPPLEREGFQWKQVDMAG